MLGPIDYFFWLAVFLLEVFIVVRAVVRNDFYRYLPLNLYVLADALVSVGRFFVLQEHGLTSAQYVYFYYYSDALLTILLFFAILGLYHHVFHEMQVSKYIRGAAILVLGLTAAFSYQVVNQHAHRMIDRFVVELSQNLYFVGLLLTWLLWIAVMKLRETRVRILQLVLALGIFFSAFAGIYALRNLYPGTAPLLQVLTPLVGLWLPAAWAYTFMRHTEEARLLTARLAHTVR